MDKISPLVEQLESERLYYRLQEKRFWSLVAVIAPLSALLIYALGSIDPIFGFITLGVSLIIVVALSFTLLKSSKREYLSAYKRLVIPEILKQFDTSLQFSEAMGISKETFRSAELYKRPDRYRSEDLIHGTYGKTQLKFGEVHAKEKRTKTDSDGKRSTYYVDIFKGIIFVADFHKEFSGRTFVFPDNAESMFGRVGRKFQKLGGRHGTKLVQMDDPAFEKNFAIYSSDEVECRYLLTNSMMERINRMKQRLGDGAIHLSLKNSVIYIGIPYSRAFLEPSANVSALDRAQIEMLIHQIHLFLGIVEELNLNTRIWSKE